MIKEAYIFYMQPYRVAIDALRNELNNRMLNEMKCGMKKCMSFHYRFEN